MAGGLFTFRGKASVRAEIFLGVAAAAAVLGIWEAVARAGLIQPQFLPAPSKVMQALWTMATQQNLLWHALISTLWRCPSRTMAVTTVLGKGPR